MEEEKIDFKTYVIIGLVIILLVLILVLISRLRGAVEPEISDSLYNTFDIADCIKGTCAKEFKYIDNTIIVVKNSNNSYKIKYNDYVIFASENKPYLGSNIYTFGNAILFATKDDNNNYSLYKYEPGNSKAILVELPNENWYVNSISVEKEKVTIETSRFENENRFYDELTKSFAKISTCDDYNEFKNRIAKQTYEFTYSESGISPIKSINTKKLSELSNYSKLCK